MKNIVSTFLLTLFLSSFAFAQQSHPCNCPGPFNYDADDIEVALRMNQSSPVKSLDLGMQKLTSIDPRIAELTELECLDLSFNRFSKLPAEFAQLKNLQCLKLTGCNFLSSLPDILKELPNLKYVDVTDRAHQWSATKKQEQKDKLPGATVVTD